MSNLVLLLALPLVLAPFIAPRDRIVATAAQLIMAGLGTAAFHQGAGTLDPGTLRTIAQQSAHDQWFVGITAGAMITGTGRWPAARAWRLCAVSLPLLACVGWVGSAAVQAALVGAAVGCLPLVLAQLGRPRRAVASSPPRSRGVRLVIALLVIAAVAHLLVTLVIPFPMMRWQPVVDTLLVAGVLVTTFRRRWDAAAAALVTLAATREGSTALAVALAMAASPLAWRAAARSNGGRTVRIATLGAGVLAALLVAVLLKDQVLLAVILAFGLAAAAIRVVAPPSPRVHL